MPITNAIVLPSHKIYTYGRTVSGSGLMATYQLPWLTDGQSSRPIKAAGSSGSWSVASSGGNINFAALINTNIKTNATATGVLAGGTFLASPEPPDGVMPNPYVALLNATTGALLAGSGSGATGFSVAGNPTTIIVGEYVAGEAFELERPIKKDAERELFANSVEREDDWDFLPAYDLNAAPREFVGNTTCTTVGLAKIQDWWKGQRGHSLPSVLVPTPAIPDAWYGRLMRFRYTKRGPEEFFVQIHFRAYAGVRWD